MVEDVAEIEEETEIEVDSAETIPEEDIESQTEEPMVDGDEDDELNSDIEFDEDECILRTNITSTSYRFDGLENGVVYGFRLKAIDAARNESESWSNEVIATPRPVNDFWETYKEAGGKEDGGFCFYRNGGLRRLRYRRGSFVAPIP